MVITDRSPNGVMGEPYSFSPKDASPPPDTEGLEYTLLGSPKHYTLKGKPKHYTLKGKPKHYTLPGEKG